MCIIKEYKPKRNVVTSKINESTLLYYKLIKDGDPDYFGLTQEEIVFLTCFDGKELLINDPGTYKLLGKPAKIIWVSKVPSEVKVGVPKESTGLGVGFHSRIRLYPTNWANIKGIIKGEEEEFRLEIPDLRSKIKELALLTFRALQSEDISDLESYRKKFNIKLNEFLMSTELSGFTAVTSYIGFSNQCKGLETEEGT